MSNLNNNTTQLELLLQKVNELPAAGGADPVLQDKTVTPTTSTQTVTADNGYDGLDTVTVNAMPTAIQATPSISVNSSGLITASATQTAGYVTAGTKSATKQLTTQAAKTITPSTSSQTAVAKDVYTTGAVTVAAIPSNYIVPSGTKTITTNGTHDVTSYASVTVNIAGEDVTAETNEYTSLNTELEEVINSLPEAGGGSGGGASVETCNIAFSYLTNAMMGLNTICYTKSGVNGLELETIYADAYQNYTVLLENVVCNSIIVITLETANTTYEASSNIMDLESESSLWLTGGHAFLPTSSDNGTITVYNNW